MTEQIRKLETFRLGPDLVVDFERAEAVEPSVVMRLRAPGFGETRGVPLKPGDAAPF